MQNEMLFIIFLMYFSASTAKASNVRGMPVPGAVVLDRVLSKFLNQSDYTDSIMDFLRGNDPRRRSDHWDVGVLDAYNVRNIIRNIQQRHSNNTRRQYNWQAYYEYPDSEAIRETALDMMRQSVYATKFRMNETRKFRKRYASDISFHIAVLYGALMQVNIKMETILTIMRRLPKRTHFLWWLVMYEKILAANVDAHDMVDRIFDLNDKYNKGHSLGMPVEIAPTIPLPTQVTNPRRSRRTRTRPPTVRTQRVSMFSFSGEMYGAGETETSTASSSSRTRATTPEMTLPGGGDDDQAGDTMTDQKPDTTTDEPVETETEIIATEPTTEPTTEPPTDYGS